jgi:hypothetical protein
MPAFAGRTVSEDYSLLALVSLLSSYAFTLLRRLDCVLEPTKQAVLAENNARTKAKVNPEYAAARRGSNTPQGIIALT